jgi:hypothetical protein
MALGSHCRKRTKLSGKRKDMQISAHFVRLIYVYLECASPTDDIIRELQAGVPEGVMLVAGNEH